MAERVASFVFQDKNSIDLSGLSCCKNMSVKVMLLRDKRVL